MYCLNCGKQMDDSSLFCMACGTKVGEVQKTVETQKTAEVQETAEAAIVPEVTPEIVVPTNGMSKDKEKNKQKTKNKKKVNIGLVIGLTALFVVVIGVVAVLSMGLLDKPLESITSTIENVTEGKKTGDSKEAETGGYSLEPGGHIEVEGVGTVYADDGALEEASEVELTYDENNTVEGQLSGQYELILESMPLSAIIIEVPLPENYDPSKHMIGIVSSGVAVSEGMAHSGNIYIEPLEVSDTTAQIAIDPMYFSEISEADDVSFIKNDFDSTLSVYDSILEMFSITSYAKTLGKYHVKLGFFDTEFWYDNGHFRIVNEQWVGSLSKASVDAFMADLEKAYDDFIGRNYTYDLRTKWPMYVYVKPLSDEGAYVHSAYAVIQGTYPDLGYIEVRNTAFLDGYTSGELMPLIGHEWFHFVQNNYTPENDVYWLDEATACYFESVYSGREPSITAQYWEKAFSSMIPADSVAAEGYARYPLAKYLVNTYKEDVIHNIYKALQSGSDIRTALESATGTTIAQLTNGYYLSMIKGEVGQTNAYSYFKGCKDNESLFNQFGQKLELTLPDFSALSKEEAAEEISLGKGEITINKEAPYIFSLDISSDLLAMTNTLTQWSIEASDSSLNVHLIRMKGLQVESVSGVGSIKDLNDIQSYLNDGWYYMVALVNGSDQPVDVSLEVKAKFIPTMDELNGQWTQATMLLDDFYISPEMLASINAMFEGLEDEFEGCETSDGTQVSLTDLDSLVGSYFDVLVNIVKIDDTTGTIAYEQPQGSSTDMFTLEPLPFAYDKGTLVGSVMKDDTQFDVVMHTYYADKDKVGLYGHISIDYMKGVMTLDSDLESIKDKP